jgi:hypothetical protein
MLAPRQIKRRHHLGQSQNQLVCLNGGLSAAIHRPSTDNRGHIRSEWVFRLTAGTTHVTPLPSNLEVKPPQACRRYSIPLLLVYVVSQHNAWEAGRGVCSEAERYIQASLQERRLLAASCLSPLYCRCKPTCYIGMTCIALPEVMKLLHSRRS